MTNSLTIEQGGDVFFETTADGDDVFIEIVAGGSHLTLPRKVWIDFCHATLDAEVEARWTGPPEIRARVAMEQTDAFARSYLDPAEWTPDGIRPANGYAFDKLRHLRSLKDVKLLQPQERAA